MRFLFFVAISSYSVFVQKAFFHPFLQSIKFLRFESNQANHRQHFSIIRIRRSEITKTFRSCNFGRVWCQNRTAQSKSWKAMLMMLAVVVWYLHGLSCLALENSGAVFLVKGLVYAVHLACNVVERLIVVKQSPGNDQHQMVSQRRSNFVTLYASFGFENRRLRLYQAYRILQAWHRYLEHPDIY